MTPKQRARTMIAYLNSRDPTGYLKWEDLAPAPEDYFTRQLIEAQTEALDSMAWGKLTRDAYREGYRAAREAAAKVCEVYPPDVFSSRPVGVFYAAAIRDLEPDR